MKLSKLMKCLAILALMATPALAKHKAKKAIQDLTTIKQVASAPPSSVVANPANHLFLQLSTGGTVEIVLRPDVAPNHVARIQQLVQAHFYDGLKFHRVIEGFMAQGGDPKGDGTGGSSLPDLKAEFNNLPHLRGTMAMARADDDNSANSQFYICFMPVLKLDHKYTVLGRVVKGMNAVDALPRGEPPENPGIIVHAWLASDNYTPVQQSAPAPVAQPIAPVSSGQPALPPSRKGRDVRPSTRSLGAGCDPRFPNACLPMGGK
jgi:cyclophilin family peptidyl-prolyl cis-trans isomerase